jgi:hypothetical protein
MTSSAAATGSQCGFGVGFEDGNNNGFHGSSGDDVWGGSVGAQWTWGRKPVPYVMK